MANNQSSVRFDHREIAVIFSLFVFVSLLMFTVGILVGKGLSQARYEGQGKTVKTAALPDTGHAASENHADSGTSITTGHDEHGDAEAKPKEHATAEEHDSHGKKAEVADKHGDEHAKKEEHHGDKHEERSVAGLDHEAPSSAVEQPELELVPKHPKSEPVGSLEDYPKTKEHEAILKNPKMAGLFEGGHKESSPRATASIGTGKIPKSFPQGKFTVQVGSYPNQREALERVENLKKLGFPYAYFSAKELADRKETWFRVWLGFFPDTDSAKVSGEILQSRGEVNSYIVRKSQSDG